MRVLWLWWERECSDSGEKESALTLVRMRVLWLWWEWESSDSGESESALTLVRIGVLWLLWEWECSDSGENKSALTLVRMRVLWLWREWECSDSGGNESALTLARMRVLWLRWEWECSDSGDDCHCARLHRVSVAGKTCSTYLGIHLLRLQTGSLPFSQSDCQDLSRGGKTIWNFLSHIKWREIIHWTRFMYPRLYHRSCCRRIQMCLERQLHKSL